MSLGQKLPAFLERAYPEFLGPSSAAWRVFLSALFGLPLDDAGLTLFQAHTGRSIAPTKQAREGWFIIGRRGGKTRITGLLAVFLACVKQYQLAAGERGIVMLIAADRRQARVLKRYISGLLNQRPEFQGDGGVGDSREDRPHQRHHDRDPHRQLPGHPRIYRRRGGG